MKVEIYSGPSCKHCIRAKAMLTARDIHYEDIDAASNKDLLVNRVVASGNHPPRTIPQIFIDNQYVGGADELEIWLSENPASE
jgi:glutaredoxin